MYIYPQPLENAGLRPLSEIDEMPPDTDWEQLEGPVLKDLNEHGIMVDDLSWFMNTRQPYPDAVPILIEHLKTSDSVKLCNILARALTCNEAKGRAEQALIDAYQRVVIRDDGDRSSRWGIGNAIGVVCSADYYDAILPLVLDKTGGMARQMLVTWLGKVKTRPEVIDVLVECLKQEDIALHAVGALRKLKRNAKSAIPALRKLTSASNPHLARKASETIEAIRSASG